MSLAIISTIIKKYRRDALLNTVRIFYARNSYCRRKDRLEQIHFEEQTNFRECCFSINQVPYMPRMYFKSELIVSYGLWEYTIVQGSGEM